LRIAELGWKPFFDRRKWRKEISRQWQEDNPSWEQDWQEPDEWEPGEREWIEGEDSIDEKMRRKRWETQVWYQEKLAAMTEE
jgi:hypothetical protein